MILTTVEPTLERGYGERLWRELRWLTPRREQEPWQGAHRLRIPICWLSVALPDYIEIQNFVNVNVLDFEYHLARRCALLLSEAG